MKENKWTVVRDVKRIKSLVKLREYRVGEGRRVISGLKFNRDVFWD